MEINVGEKAPNFALRAHDRSLVTLEQFRDKKVVLLFFPLAFTRTCTKELCSLRDDLQAYNELDAQILAISVDSLFVLDKFREEYGYNFPLLSDFNKEVCRSYGALHEEFALGIKGVAKRSVFVIDGSGSLRHKEIMENPSNLPDFQKVKDVLAAI